MPPQHLPGRRRHHGSEIPREVQGHARNGDQLFQCGCPRSPRNHGEDRHPQARRPHRSPRIPRPARSPHPPEGEHPRFLPPAQGRRPHRRSRVRQEGGRSRTHLHQGSQRRHRQARPRHRHPQRRGGDLRSPPVCLTGIRTRCHQHGNLRGHQAPPGSPPRFPHL